jgi:hypothetical protein
VYVFEKQVIGRCKQWMQMQMSSGLRLNRSKVGFNPFQINQ